MRSIGNDPGILRVPRALLALVLLVLLGCGEEEVPAEDPEFARMAGRVRAAFAQTADAARAAEVKAIVGELESGADAGGWRRRLLVELLFRQMSDAEAAGDRARLGALRKRRETWLRRTFEDDPARLAARIELARELAETGRGREAWALMEEAIPEASRDLADAGRLVDGSVVVLANLVVRPGWTDEDRRRCEERLLELTAAATGLAERPGVTRERAAKAWTDHCTLLFRLGRLEEARAALEHLTRLDPGGVATLQLERWLRETPSVPR